MTTVHNGAVHRKRKKMIMRTRFQTATRELDRRTKDGFDIRLLWDPYTDRVLVDVNDQQHDESFTFEADPAEALQAFHHPFAYPSYAHEPVSLPGQHVPTSLPPREEQA
jgi:hypothetical protein